jgi:peptidoglycan hydrolase-like protein with peptidoglycan-binding domain
MNRKCLILLAIISLLPRASFAYVDCRDTTNGCSVAQLVEISNQTFLTTQDRISALQQAITMLTTQISTLQASGGTNTSSATCVDLNNALVIGSTDATTNGEITKLQRFLLAAGAYPEAQITGYYGNLTAQAVVRWQKAHGMDFVTTASGVGPMTRGKMKCVSTTSTSNTPVQK